MEDGRQHQNGRYKVDNYYNVAHSPWGIMAPHQVKEQPNALVMNKMAMEKRMMAICAERDVAIEECNIALAEKKEAFAERDEAFRQRDKAFAERDKAFAERDKAFMERDNAHAAIQYRENAINFPSGNGNQRGSKGSVYHSDEMVEALKSEEIPISDALPIAVSPEAAKSRQTKRSKENKAALVRATKLHRKGDGVGEDLNGQGTTNGKKFRSDWDNQDIGLNMVSFDESTMPAPVCTCTGNPHQCYKWGNGGWQSACCTTTMSSYPLPQMPNKRHARVGGRKMSGSVFTKLLSRLAAEGYDLSLPLDLKDYWARHGTNRYITIK